MSRKIYNRLIIIALMLIGMALIVTLELPAQIVSKQPVAASFEELPQQDSGPPAYHLANQPAELFPVRAEGATGPLVAYEMPAGREKFRLPPGLPAADGSRYYSTVVEAGQTRLKVFDPQTGRLEQTFNLNGPWRLSGVSPDGRRVALTGLVSQRTEEVWTKENRWQTAVQIVDTQTGQVVHALQLEGNFEVETISATGDALFLIQHLPAVHPTQYLVRLYDLAAGQLQPGALRAKTATDEVMTGLAWGGVASPDGRWLLTLYLNTQRNVAFIHALNLQEQFPLCIDLPSGDGDFEKLKHYSLTLTPDGQTVYAANAALGVVARVSLNSFQVIRQTEFAPSAPPAAIADATTGLPTNYSVISKDGQMLYFSSGWDVWGYDTKSTQISGPYLSDTPIRGLALSGDEQRLYVAVDQEAPRVVDLMAGQALSFKR